MNRSPATPLAGLLPRGVIGEVLPDDMTPEPLADDEAAIVAGAIARRQFEFAAGRTCARRALERLGLPAPTLLRDADRVPTWPPGTVGSITHTSGFCAAIVASSGEFRGIGIDAEHPIGADLEAVLDQICVPAERAWLDRFDRLERPRRAALVFSAKESLYKCVFPSTRRWLGFRDAMVTIARDEGDGESGSMNFAVHGEAVALHGRFAFRGNLVITVVAMEA